MSLDDTQVYLPELWANYARFQPERTAIVCGVRRQSWYEFNVGMNVVANRLLSRRVSRGARVAVLMSNSIEMLHVMFGAVKAGACVVPLSTMLTPQQLAALLQDSGSSVLFASETVRPLAEAALTAMAPSGSPPLLRVLFGVAASGWESAADWLAGESINEPAVRYRMDDDFNIIYSSGTTGTPKGIVQTHRARQHWSYSNALELRFDNSAVALTTTALYSNGTWFMLLPPLFVGATVVILEAFSVEGFIAAVERERITHTFMVPTQYIGLLESPRLAGADLSALRVMLSAGSPLRDDTKRAVLERIGRGLFELYGFSEGFATMIKPEDISRKHGSVGKPVVGFDLRIIGERDEELGAEQAGEIVGYGGGLMRGYHGRDDLTNEGIWRDARGRTFFRSGDIGKLDAEGFLYILDRKKDMILSGGFNVFPKDIEAVVAEHPDVLDVTVIGVPHPKWGETPLALVIPRAGCAVEVDELRSWANERLAKTQRLGAVELRDEFPRNALGKVLKRVLREPYWRDARP